MSNTVSTPEAASPDERRLRLRRRRAAENPLDRTSWAAVTGSFSLPDEEPLSLTERIRNWIFSAAAAGYGMSLLVHAIILIVMSLVVIHELARQEQMNTTVTESGEVEQLEDVMDVRIDLPAGELTSQDALETALNMETSDMVQNPVATGIDESLDSLFEKNGGGGGGGFQAPSSARVFTKGSFSAWTIPNDPKPGEEYQIVIVVRLPDRVKRYQASDLKGLVIGTDGYKQAIPGPEFSRGRVYLPMKDHTAQLVVTVPGAQQRVRDTIEIRSTTLREKQVLQIEF